MEFFFLCSSDPPSPPRWLEVINITKNSADLKWTVPEKDGGSPITNYIVEKRDVRRKGWQTVDTTVKETKCTVTPLTEGSLYVFRVAAENAIGQSDYTEIGDSVLAKDTFSRHHNLVFAAAFVASNTSSLGFFSPLVILPTATPGPPYALTVVDVTKRHVDLKWEPPKNDGGRPIQRYIFHSTLLKRVKHRNPGQTSAFLSAK